MRLPALIRRPVVPRASRDDAPDLRLHALDSRTWAVLSTVDTVALDHGEIVGIAEQRPDGGFVVRFPGEIAQPMGFDSLAACIGYFDEYVFALHLGR
jgi:hypothetical protein